MKENPTSASEEQQNLIRGLVEKSQKGDISAFGKLIELYQEKAYGLALVFLRNHADAEDVSQEAFIRAFKNLHSFKASGSFGSWLIKITVNLSKNKLRWRRIREKITFSLDQLITPDEDSERPVMQVADTDKTIDPSLTADQVWKNQQLSQAMDGLSVQQRTAIHLKFIQGYTIREIAEIMDLAEGTVKVHIFRGLEGLKKSYQGKERE